MRDLGYLVQLFPDKTGKELMEIQKKDKEADDFAYQQAHKADLELIKDINTNGGYYRGFFGLDQYYFYSFTNMRMESDRIYCDCEHITIFKGEDKRSVCDGFRAEIRKETYKQFENYGVDMEDMITRITKKEWDEVVNYLKKSIELFWPVNKK